MKIGELAQIVGVSTPTIRFYESIGLLPEPKRESGWRIYGVEELEKLKVIHAARTVGFSLEDIKQLLDDFPKSTKPSERWSKIAGRKLSELDKIIESTKALKFMIEAGQDCACDDIALCLNSEGIACRPKTHRDLRQKSYATKKL